jgi:hypothetical protein
MPFGQVPLQVGNAPHCRGGGGGASQQLVTVPTLPSFAVQRAASALMLHFVPLGVKKEHVTAPGLPHVD